MVRVEVRDVVVLGGGVLVKRVSLETVDIGNGGDVQFGECAVEGGEGPGG